MIDVGGNDHHHAPGGEADEKGEVRDVESPADMVGHVGDNHSLCDLMRPRIDRAGDILARYGGEEFVIALMGVGEQQSTALAEGLRAAIENLAVDFDNRTIRFTASFGVVCAVPNGQHQVRDFLSAADRALYEAKDSGRNTVRVATLTA